MTRLGPQDEGGRLADVLYPRLQAALGPRVSRSVARRLIIAGAVRVDGRVVRTPGWEVRGGAKLEVQVDLARLPASPECAQDVRLPILYEDADVIAVNKPPGIPAVPTADPRRTSVVAVLMQMLRDREGAGAEDAYLGVHQRLDLETSGVVVFVKRREANEWLSRAFATHAVRKDYVALTMRPRAVPSRAWRVDQPVGGQEALTQFSVVKAFAEALLVEARPTTGRKHQVRLHLAASGLPILGDTRYGGPARIGRVVVPRVMLHAARLVIPRPSAGSPLVLEAPLPADFEDVLRVMRASPGPRPARGGDVARA